MCTLSICASTVLAAGSQLRDLISGQRLRSLAQELEAEIHLAKSSALVRGQTVRLAVQPTVQGTCRIIHTGPRDACTCPAEGLPVCEPDAQVLHLQRHAASTGVRFTSNPMSLAFSADRGTVTPTATFKLADDRGRALHQVVNVMGRTRSCMAGSQLFGYKSC